jgi:hypothetical protein
VLDGALSVPEAVSLLLARSLRRER